MKSLRFKEEPEDVQENTNGEANEEDKAEEPAEEEDEDDEETGVEILEGPRDMTVLKGQSATFSATFTGNPKPVVSWLKKVSVRKDNWLPVRLCGYISVSVTGIENERDTGKEMQF